MSTKIFDIGFIVFGLALLSILMYMVGERIYWMTLNPDTIIPDYAILVFVFGVMCVVGAIGILGLREKIGELE